VEELELSVVEFVALVNQTLEFAYSSVTITGELANYRVSKNRWVYFDLKDDEAIVHFFGTIYQLPGPLEEGMLLKVKASPRLHPRYGFTLNVQRITPSGAGSIKKAASLLQAKLASEGLFDVSRKRPLPYPPQKIGLITSSEAAAYTDFMKILRTRWAGTHIQLSDITVQGEQAISQIVAAIETQNALPTPCEVLVIIRGGGSAEDLQAFNSEPVTRAVATSRIPTMVAIGHERDISLAELAADQRASTPSNAAELLVPDKNQVVKALIAQRATMRQKLITVINNNRESLTERINQLKRRLQDWVNHEKGWLNSQQAILQVLSPEAALAHGYALILQSGKLVGKDRRFKVGEDISVLLHASRLYAKITAVEKRTNVSLEDKEKING
jgi:exodeoxyribonuclease VII large subunit